MWSAQASHNAWLSLGLDPAWSVTFSDLITQARHLMGAHGAWLTLKPGADLHVTLGVSDPMAEIWPDLENLCGEGPTLSSHQTGRVCVANLDSVRHHQWPRYAELAAATHPPSTIVAIPVRAGRTIVAAAGFRLSLHQAPIITLPAAALLASAIGTQLLRGERTLAGLIGASRLANERTIHQACGMIAEQLTITIADATALLRSHAYAHNRRVYEIARHVVDRTLVFTDPPR